MRAILVRRESLFLYAALALALVGIVFAYATSPTRLTVAVGPASGPDAALMKAFAAQLATQKTDLRLKVVPVAGEREAAAALDRGAVDLAVVRPDVALPQSGLTMAILREAAAIIVAPAASKITDLPSLSGTKLGIVAGHEADPAFVAGLLKHYDLDADDVALLPLGREEVGRALKSGRIAAAVLVAPAAGTNASDFIHEISRLFDGKITIVPVDEADAISQRQASVEEVSIPSGIWGGRPKQPEAEVKTAAVSYRLMASSALDRATVSDTTQNLFQMRSRLAATARSANLMKAPETDTSTSATLPNHPGAVDYFQREQKTVFERYGDWIYLSAIFGSGILSLLAWIRQRLQRRHRDEIEDVADRLLLIVPEARAAATVERLDELGLELETLLGSAVDYARDSQSSSRMGRALAMALEGARAAVADRRAVLSGYPPAPKRGVPPRLVTTQ